MVKYQWMPDFNEDYLYNKINEDMNNDVEMENFFSNGRNLIEQGLQITFSSWIRQMLLQIKNDCLKRTGNISQKIFVSNCQEIFEKEIFFPLVEKSKIRVICSKLKN